MPRPLRFVPEEFRNWTNSQGRPIAVHEVTVRTILGMFLLKPTPANRELIVGVMAHVQERLQFELYGYAWLSNHGSYLIGVNSAEHLSAIMRELHSQLATELGRPQYSNWSGAFWARRGRPIQVVTEADLVERLKYCLANSTKEHLVKRPELWPGAHAARALCGDMADRGIWIDRTRLDALKRRVSYTYQQALTECTSTVTLTLSKLPCWAHLSDDEYRHKINAMCREISDEAFEVRRNEGIGVIGIKRLLRYSPHHIPDSLDRSPAPKVHCSCPEFRAALFSAYRNFVEAYQRAVDALRAGLHPVLFPEGGIPPAHTYVPDLS